MRMRFLAFCAISFFFIGIMLAGSGSGYARSAMSPRHSGIEPPGGPKQLDVITGRSPGRTAEGGMGYSDAYGNTLTDRMPEEKKPRKRPRPGAYGGEPMHAAELPEPAREKTPPVWSFK